MSYLQEAFDQICTQAKTPEGFYVCLLERQPRYGGPEEGGWWTSDTVVVAYQYYETQEAAEAVRDAVEKLADQLERQARREYGEQCLREMDWLDARGLDADYLPEPDGPAEYSVIVSHGLPENHYGPTQWE